MTSRFPILILLSALVAPAYSQTAFDPIAAQVRTEPLLLPAEVSIVSLTPGDQENSRQAYSLVRTFNADGSFSVDWKTLQYQTKQTFRADGTLVTGRQINLAKALSVEATTDQKRASVHTVITDQGKVKSDKRVDLVPGIVLREEMQYVILQSWLYGVRDGLKFRSLSPDGGLVGDFQVVFRPVTDPTSVSTKYTYPAEFKTTLGTKNSYLVADMSLQGVAALFYPHHFYLVFEVMPTGLEWRGYFGEDPKAPVFQYWKR